MSFVSVAFFVLFALTLAAQWLLPSRRLRQLALLAASYVFYGWWDWRFCFLMLFLTAVAFFTGLRLEKKPGSRPALALGVTVPLAVLFFFKYMGFFVDSFCALFGLNPAGALRILLPVGISFYTFQSLSYTIDAYRGKVAISHDFCKFALYIAFFPQLVAGPIVKAADFLPQLEEDRRPTGAGVAQGMNLFLWGMLKKAVFADQISPFVDSVFATPAAFSSGTVALAVLAYAIQIYFDFSGYSDMAIGCAKCLGYDLMKNFDLPYLSRNVSEFWKRWHISLSTWLMEYLYIPLGGNRKGRARTYLNLMITMLLGGLWHGAGINFILWGGFHGLALCAHKAWARKFPAKPGFFRAAAATLCTFVFVCLCWIPFRAQTFSQTRAVLQKLFCWSGGVVFPHTWSIAAIVLLVLATLYCVFRNRDAQGRVHGDAPVFRLGSFWGTFAFALLAGFVLVLMYTGDNPFIYFQF
ncbi:MAG: MBOAT family protein [Eubacteriales bacterium]|nr:MBOAT family protein [Eubacteriales bacterium]